MVNFRDRAGSYGWDKGRPDVTRNPRMYRQGIAWILPSVVVGSIFVRYSSLVKEWVDSWQYWTCRVRHKQRERVEREKAAFDLFVDAHSDPPDSVKHHSIF